MSTIRSKTLTTVIEHSVLSGVLVLKQDLSMLPMQVSHLVVLKQDLPMLPRRVSHLGSRQSPASATQTAGTTGSITVPESII